MRWEPDFDKALRESRQQKINCECTIIEKRKQECVNALSGIKNPMEFVEAAKALQNHIRDFSSERRGTVADMLMPFVRKMEKASGQ